MGLDGTFLKGPHPGVLLTVVGIDANNGICPMANAVMEGENKSTWRWFIKYLMADISITDP